MKRYLATAGIVMLSLFWEVSAFAQEVNVEELKAKGAKVLSAEEVKTLLPGATLRYETAQSQIQMSLKANGSLDGHSKRRIGGGSGTSYTGNWKVTDEGRWCGETRSFAPYGGGGPFCRDILKLGDKYYYASDDPKNDARPAVEMAVSK